TPVGRFGAGGRLYVISDRDGGLRRLWEVDGDRWRLLTGDLDHEVEAVEVSRDGRTVAFVVDVDGASELRLLDARTRKHQAARGAPRGGVIGALRFAGPGATLALSWSSPTEPSDVYTYAIASATLTRWTTSELAGLDPAALVTPTRATATAADGVVIPMWTYAPASAAGGAAAPVVVYLHGGPEQQWRPRFDPFVQLLCARGYAVVEPDVRGSTGYGRAFAMLDDGLRRRDAIADVGVVLDWIAGRDDLDAARVAVAGGSYGGFLSMASLIAHGDRLRAGIEVVGISSFVTFLEQTSAYRRDLRRAEYGDERDPEVRAFLDELSPLRHAGEIGDPLFVGHGANDPRVPVAEAEQIVEGVRAGGGDVWYLLADNEGHGFTRRENRAAYWGAVVMFLARYL
ncbi:MAG: S9 family peptidase, partial [Myxococcales bacterium]|nr:S9 family peptidase [Myxococcales bacterium]